LSHTRNMVGGMSSDNPFGAGNQQETEEPVTGLDPWWVVGFVDGEGCFSVAIHRNTRYARRTGGWQLAPVFQVYQHEKERELLHRVQSHFGCGSVVSKGPQSRVTHLHGDLAAADSSNTFFRSSSDIGHWSKAQTSIVLQRSSDRCSERSISSRPASIDWCGLHTR
jgi:hypothetical protein